jgi:hypothetical protein
MTSRNHPSQGSPKQRLYLRGGEASLADKMHGSILPSHTDSYFFRMERQDPTPGFEERATKNSRISVPRYHE